MMHKCEICGVDTPQNVADYSKNKYMHIVCYACQTKHRDSLQKGIVPCEITEKIGSKSGEIAAQGAPSDDSLETCDNQKLLNSVAGLGVDERETIFMALIQNITNEINSDKIKELKYNFKVLCKAYKKWVIDGNLD